jgi:hypothetical protein
LEPEKTDGPDLRDLNDKNRKTFDRLEHEVNRLKVRLAPKLIQPEKPAQKKRAN